MRLNLLLQREPFGAILERTLAPYWTEVLGMPVDVRWNHSAPGWQTWKGNIYLNFFCAQGVDPTCFDVITREFTHARTFWRRGLQAAYVHSAVSLPLRGILSQVQFSTSKAIPGADEQLLIGGYRRLRLNHPKAGRSIVIHKQGYGRLGFDREIAVRQGAAASIAPLFLGLVAGGKAFAEQYFVGTPANRLPPALQLRARFEACGRLINEVHRPTLRTVSLSDWLVQLGVNLAELSTEVSAPAGELIGWAIEQAGTAPIGLVCSHGDFQDANILVADRKLRVIDWENAAERSQLYDLATLRSGVRLAPEYYLAWQAEVAAWGGDPNRMPRLEVPATSRSELLAHAAVWWLEETLMRLEEAKASPYVGHLAVETQFAESLRRALVFLASFPS